MKPTLGGGMSACLPSGSRHITNRWTCRRRSGQEQRKGANPVTGADAPEWGASQLWRYVHSNMDTSLNFVYTSIMKATIQKWGNSLGVRIPKVIADDLELVNGSEVELLEDSDKIIIQPHRKLNLNDLLSAIDDDNLHGEVNSGEPVGKELW